MSRKYYGASAWILMSIASGAAFSQTAPSSDANGGLEELVVTSRKTTENLQKASATIEVATGLELEDQGIFVPTDLGKILPSASLQWEGAVTRTYIRAVGSSLDYPYISAGSAITFNGIIIPRYGAGGLLFDLSSVQEIAGPQGTLYGGSAAGGAINFITEKPSNDFSGEMLLEGGNYGEEHIAVDQNLKGSDQLSFRTSVDYNHHDGHENNGFAAVNKIAGRESVLYAPNEDVTALVFVNGYRDNGKIGLTDIPITNPLPSNPWNTPTVGAAGNPLDKGLVPNNTQAYVVGANIDWRVGGGTLTYIPAYQHIVANTDELINIGNPPCYNCGILNVNDKEVQISQELRWNQQFGALNVSAGVFWLQDNTNFNDGVRVAVLPASQGYYFDVPIIDYVHERYTSTSLFGQGIYSFNDALRLTVGARESQDRIAAHGIGNSGTEPFDIHRTQYTPDWKIGLDYDYAPQTLLYANIQTSYIPFGYNPDAVVSNYQAPVVPESKLLAFSSGFKSRFLDNRLEINDEFFYYIYRNFQNLAFDYATNGSVVATAKKSIIYGDELTVRWRLTSDTRFDASVVGLNATYTNFVAAGANYSGYDMVNAPHLNLVAGLQHGIDIGDRGYLLGRVQTNYNDGYWGAFNHWNTFKTPYTTTNLTLTYTPSGSNWRLQAYCDNVENAATFGYIGGVGPTTPGVAGLDAPRTFGARIRTSW